VARGGSAQSDHYYSRGEREAQRDIHRANRQGYRRRSHPQEEGRDDYRDKLQRESQLCFPSRSGRPLCKPFRELLAIDTVRAAKRHQWPRFRPQRFRDDFVSWTEATGVNYIDLCRLIGWRVPGMMRNYSPGGDIDRLRTIVDARAKALGG
jgi:hypothetical protein